MADEKIGTKAFSMMSRKFTIHIILVLSIYSLSLSIFAQDTPFLTESPITLENLNELTEITSIRCEGDL